jgi:hypothetical protein
MSTWSGKVTRSAMGYQNKLFKKKNVIKNGIKHNKSVLTLKGSKPLDSPPK